MDHKQLPYLSIYLSSLIVW